MIFDLRKEENSIIKVIGVGGGGSNAVTHMYKQGIVGVDFAICNTDSQAMALSPVPYKIHLGPMLTDGRGAGSQPQVGKQACLESLEEVKKFLEEGTKMLFVTAGMGGGTGTGAAPIIAKTAREMGILTVGIVTLPFGFEGRKRVTQGIDGLEELKKNVDTIITISNDKLRQIHGNLAVSAAFSQADNVLTTAAKGIAEIITVPGYVNVDFEDVNTVMRNSGVAVMGIGRAEGDNRARKAADAALSSPLLEDNNINGAKHILLNISSGTKEVTMDEVFEITGFVQEEAGFASSNLIWGNCYDESLGDAITVTVIATGFEAKAQTIQAEEEKSGKIVVPLNGPAEEKRSDFFNKSYLEGEHMKTMEFEGNPMRTQYERQYRQVTSEPYLKPEDKDKIEAERRQRQHQETQRRERLRTNNTKLTTVSVSEMENEPAYVRRGVKLEQTSHSSDTKMSRWVLNEDDELQTTNGFLHDNVD